MSDEFDQFGGMTGVDKGDIELRKVQQNGRVNIADSYLEHIGVKEGEKVMIVAEDGGLFVTKANVEAMEEIDERF